MSKTIVAVFDDTTSAQNAVRELETFGVDRNHIRVTNNSDAEPASGSWKEKIYSLFENILEHVSDRGQAHDYAEAWRRGHYIVIADVEAAQVNIAVDILNRFGTVDLERRVEQWKSSGYSGEYDQTSQPYTSEQRQRELSLYQTEQRIPVVQKELAVGKQTVRRGGVRIHSYAQERPVAERVRLREERIQVGRRPVDRPANTVRKDVDVEQVDTDEDRATSQGGQRR
jgi:stress response protein YsnF